MIQQHCSLAAVLPLLLVLLLLPLANAANSQQPLHFSFSSNIAKTNLAPRLMCGATFVQQPTTENNGNNSNNKNFGVFAQNLNDGNYSADAKIVRIDLDTMTVTDTLTIPGFGPLCPVVQTARFAFFADSAKYPKFSDPVLGEPINFIKIDMKTLQWVGNGSHYSAVMVGFALRSATTAAAEGEEEDYNDDVLVWAENSVSAPLALWNATSLKKMQTLTLSKIDSRLGITLGAAASSSQKNGDNIGFVSGQTMTRNIFLVKVRYDTGSKTLSFVSKWVSPDAMSAADAQASWDSLIFVADKNNGGGGTLFLAGPDHLLRWSVNATTNVISQQEQQQPSNISGAFTEGVFVASGGGDSGMLLYTTIKDANSAIARVGPSDPFSVIQTADAGSSFDCVLFYAIGVFDEGRKVWTTGTTAEQKACVASVDLGLPTTTSTTTTPSTTTTTTTTTELSPASSTSATTTSSSTVSTSSSSTTTISTTTTTTQTPTTTTTMSPSSSTSTSSTSSQTTTTMTTTTHPPFTTSSTAALPPAPTFPEMKLSRSYVSVSHAAPILAYSAVYHQKTNGDNSDGGEFFAVLSQDLNDGKGGVTGMLVHVALSTMTILGVMTLPGLGPLRCTVQSSRFAFCNAAAETVVDPITFARIVFVKVDLASFTWVGNGSSNLVPSVAFGWAFAEGNVVMFNENSYRSHISVWDMDSLQRISGLDLQQAVNGGDQQLAVVAAAAAPCNHGNKSSSRGGRFGFVAGILLNEQRSIFLAKLRYNSNNQSLSLVSKWVAPNGTHTGGGADPYFGSMLVTERAVFLVVSEVALLRFRLQLHSASSPPPSSREVTISHSPDTDRIPGIFFMGAVYTSGGNSSDDGDGNIYVTAAGTGDSYSCVGRVLSNENYFKIASWANTSKYFGCYMWNDIGLFTDAAGRAAAFAVGRISDSVACLTPVGLDGNFVQLAQTTIATTTSTTTSTSSAPPPTTSSPSTTTSAKNQSGGEKNHHDAGSGGGSSKTVLIVGGCAGGGMLLAMVCMALYACVTKARRRRGEGSDDEKNGHDGDDDDGRRRRRGNNTKEKSGRRRGGSPVESSLSLQDMARPLHARDDFEDDDDDHPQQQRRTFQPVDGLSPRDLLDQDDDILSATKTYNSPHHHERDNTLTSPATRRASAQEGQKSNSNNSTDQSSSSGVVVAIPPTEKDKKKENILAPPNDEGTDQQTAATLLEQEIHARFPRNFIYRSNEVELIKHIGTGGQGTVWKAKMKLKNVEDWFVAVKMFREPDAIQRSLAECEQAIKLRHRNICSACGLVVNTSGLTSDLLMIMDLADASLDGVLRASPQAAATMPFDRCFRWAMQAAQGLKFLHSRSPPLLHLDIKPANALLFSSNLRLCDFGLSKNLSGDHTDVTDVSRVGAGTLRWADPLQLQQSTVGPRQDVYSFGAILFYFVCGVEPWKDCCAQQILHGRLLDHVKPREGCPEMFAELCRRCLDPDLSKRPANGAELVAALQAMTTAAAESGGFGFARAVSSDSATTPRKVSSANSTTGTSSSSSQQLSSPPSTFQQPSYNTTQDSNNGNASVESTEVYDMHTTF